VITAVCPNGCEDKEFTTTAHVVEEWLVDEHGDFIQMIEMLEVAHAPQIGNIWTCHECGEVAIVTETP
jgi:rubrerythrin